MAHRGWLFCDYQSENCESESSFNSKQPFSNNNSTNKGGKVRCAIFHPIKLSLFMASVWFSFNFRHSIHLFIVNKTDS